MYVKNRVLYDSDNNPCVIGDRVEITCDDGKVIIDTIIDVTDEQDKGFEDNEIYLKGMCIPLYDIEKVYKIFPEEKVGNDTTTLKVFQKVTDKELLDIYKDITKSKELGIRPRSIDKYMERIKESGHVETISQAIDLTINMFYEEVAMRYFCSV